jgi:hypothetical protein
MYVFTELDQKWNSYLKLPVLKFVLAEHLLNLQLEMMLESLLPLESSDPDSDSLINYVREN